MKGQVNEINFLHNLNKMKGYKYQSVRMQWLWQSKKKKLWIHDNGTKQNKTKMKKSHLGLEKKKKEFLSKQKNIKLDCLSKYIDWVCMDWGYRDRLNKGKESNFWILIYDRGGSKEGEFERTQRKTKLTKPLLTTKGLCTGVRPAKMSEAGKKN